MAEPALSVVVPVYGCRSCLGPLHRRLLAALEPVLGDDFELVFVDDRSPDGSWEVLVGLAEQDARVRAVRLTRNFGQQAAITAGLSRTRGARVVVMDCDLEEPPEVIPRLLEAAAAGHDIVFTRREGRQGVAADVVGRVYYRLRNVFLGTSTAGDLGTLSLLSRQVVDAYLDLRDRDREYLAALEWLGFSSTCVEFEREPRFAGESAYTWRKLLRVGLDGLFFQTTVLLRWVVLAGMGVALAGLLLAVYYLYTYIVSDPLPGYTSIAVLLLVLSGFILVTLGVIGVYVGKVFEQAKGRPLYLIEREQSQESVEPSIEQVWP